MRRLTDEQERAVARREGSLLLAAAAGSGKTSVLVERFVRAVLEDGIAPGRILAITFTERAAGELKLRVRARLQELGERELARDTESAFVSTFHSFCARLLRTHPLAAGIGPGFEIIDRAWSRRLQDLAFREALGELQEREGERAVELAAAYGAEPLRKILFGAYAELRSRGQLEPRLPEPVPRIDPDLARSELSARIPASRRELLNALEGSPSERLQNALESLQRASALLAASPEGTAPGVPSPGSLAGLNLPRATTGPLCGPACEDYGHALARYGEACADRLGARDCVLLDALLQQFSGHYAKLERERGGLDFDDLELRARMLLEEHEDIRRAWSERFALLMVDEFQDTNARQLAILEALERENLFTVGDELQAIYGFREADVRIFRARRAELAERDGCLELTGNFRARPELIAAVNAVFGARLGRRYTPLVAARAEPSEQASTPLIELLLSDTCGWDRVDASDGERSPGAGSGPGGARRWRAAEARLLARRIYELVETGGARAGEVVVLLRATSDLPLYERALQERGLSTIAAAGRFWGGQQVGDLLSYLRTLANPLDELALCSTLCSPLVGLSSDGLVRLSRAAREARQGIWEAIGANAGGVRGLGDRDRRCLESFGERLARERESASWRTISELLERAIGFTGYERHVLSLQGGERRLANVHKLLALTRRFEESESPDLRGFLDHVSALQSASDGGEADGGVAVGDLDAVRLMSIHAAKGLEFPVVCLADLGRAPRTSSPPALLVDGERLGLRVSMADGSQSKPSLDYERLLEERRRSEAEEEERIFYVGMTRARERLILSGAVEFGRWPELKPGAAPIAWLAPALLSEMPELQRAVERPVQDLRCDGAEDVTVRCVLNVPTGVDRSQAEIGPQQEVLDIARATGAGEQAAGVEACELREPAHEWVGAARLQGSLSYTALSELERCGYRYYLERVLGLGERYATPEADEPGRLQARERGTIMHNLLETHDFARDAGPSTSEIARVEGKLELEISIEQREEILALVDGALHSTLGRRLATTPTLRREYPFAFTLGAEGRLMTGVLDAIATERDGAALVVDYKSDLVEGDEDLEVRVQRDYGVQRLVYALAALRAGAPHVDVIHWFLQRPGEWVEARFEASQSEALERDLLARIERLEAAGFAVSGTPHRRLCLGCPGRGTLCSWPEEQTSRELPIGSA